MIELDSDSGLPREHGTLVGVLRARARAEPDRLAFAYSFSGEEPAARLTYGQLDRYARAIAARLQSELSPGDRALLLYPQGLDFIIAFFGCLYAAVIPVPAFPPEESRMARMLPRLLAIVDDAKPSVVLTVKAVQEMARRAKGQIPELEALPLLATDELAGEPPGTWRAPEISGETPALIQYTSGSTGRPKGVLVSHSSLLHNTSCNRAYLDAGEDAISVTWAPTFHDLGLIAGTLTPILGGYVSHVMSPIGFLRDPISWLRLISRVGATHCGGPNFAFDLCVRKRPSDWRGLDLSTLRVAYSGGEPVRPATLRAFTETFQRIGFRWSAWMPALGMAESTLTVCSAQVGEGPKLRSVSRSELENHRIKPETRLEECRELVGLGRVRFGMRAIVVDPETRRRCPPDRVGEIWIAGPSVAQGYWRNEAATQETYRAFVADGGEGPFLRTGDLGWIDSDGDVYVTGRHKDLIVVRGRNHYPQDIERTVESAHPGAFRPGCNAAFTVDNGRAEQLVVVQEVVARIAGEAKLDDMRLRQPEPQPCEPRPQNALELDGLISAIRQALFQEHGINASVVALVKPGTILKTTSGKIQRRACKQALLKSTLELVALWKEDSRSFQPGGPHERAAIRAQRSARQVEIQRWLVHRVAERFALPVARVSATEPIANYGLDSLSSVEISAELGRWIGRALPATLLWDYPSIERLSIHLARDERGAGEAPEAAGVVEMLKGNPDHEPIAIVGFACRFPGAPSAADFWRLLLDGGDAIREVPRARFDIDAWFDRDRDAPGKTITRWGGFLEDVTRMDFRFFGLSAIEAAKMDPQQRLLLEIAWEALEDAGFDIAGLAKSRTGVFVGISSFDYSRLVFSDPCAIDAHCATGTALSIAANRLSYVFDFTGPSVAVDTACSSSLFAVLQACDALRRGDCSLALAGGVNVILSPYVAVNFTKAGVMSPDGRCKPFDARADGYVRSEGAGVVVLKPLSQALAAGDRIAAVILGGASNSDGRSNGLMAPNRLAQEDVLREAYRRAGVSPGTVQYVEAHGTGTAVGDAIEAAALGNVLGTDRQPNVPCVLGSVKSNIGHLEAAAGIAGLIKVVLSLRHGMLPGTVHFATPNPMIPFRELGLEMRSALGPWPGPEWNRVAGISSFGFGGTNVHLVVAAAPSQDEDAGAEPDELSSERELVLPLSARAPGALKELARRYATRVVEPTDSSDLLDLCRAASLRRSHLPHRLAVSFASRAELVAELEAFAREQPGNRSTPDAVTSPNVQRPLAFIFPGQGPQWWGMGRELLQRERAFRHAVEQCDVVIREVAGWSLLEELSRPEEHSRVNQTEFTQPLLFAVEVGLAALWRSWGLVPDVVLGHSMGEVAAAFVSGALELSDAVRVIVERGRVMKQAQGHGAMAAAEISFEQAQLLLAGFSGRLAIAAHNGPTSVVLSGDPEPIREAVETLQRYELDARLLQVDVAAHGPAMGPLALQLERSLDPLRARPTLIPLISTVTGSQCLGTELDVGYWARNLRQPVQFMAAFRSLWSHFSDPLVVEVGPHPVLQGAIEQLVVSAGSRCEVLHSLRRGEPDGREMMRTLARLWACGRNVEWAAVWGGKGKSVPLPSYPWQRERCWVQTDAEDDPSRPRHPLHPVLGPMTEIAGERPTWSWQSTVRAAYPRYLDEHRIESAPVFPATGYLDVASAAACQALRVPRVRLSDWRFQKALVLSEEEPRTVQVVLSPSEVRADEWIARVLSRRQRSAESPWTLHASGQIVPCGEGPISEESEAILRPSSAAQIDAPKLYQDLAQQGLRYGPSFRGIEALWSDENHAWARVRLPESIEGEARLYAFHPALLDACLQTVAAPLRWTGTRRAEGTFVPIAIEQYAQFRPVPKTLEVHAQVRTEQEGFAGDIRIFDVAGRKVAEVMGLRLAAIDGASTHASVGGAERWIYQLKWAPVELPATISAGHRSGGTWLILSERGTELGRRLADSLGHERGCAPAIVIEDACERDLEERLTAVPPGADLSGVAVLGVGAGTESPRLSADASLQRIIGQLRILTRWIDASSPTARLWLVTRGTQCVGNERQLPDLVHAATWGLGRTLALEQPQRWGGLVDLDPELSDDESASALSGVLRGDGREDQIAFRYGRVWAPRLVRAPPGFARSAAVRGDGTYLVTGGLGGLGLEVARWMARKGAGRIVLVGRSLPSTGSAPIAGRFQRVEKALREMEELGTRVELVAADVAERRDVERLFQQLGATGPPLRGVVHAAGVIGVERLSSVTCESVTDILRPKVRGGWLIHQATRDILLDWFVLFSSAASVWGSQKLGVYAAANHFLDALAHYRRALRLPALAINWAMWGEVGMASDPSRANELGQMGLRPMAPDAVLGAMDQLLSSGAAQRVVADVDWEVFRPLYEWSRARPLLREMEGVPGAAPLAEKRHGVLVQHLTGSARPERRLEALEDFLVAHVATVTGLRPEELDHDMPLQRLGLDSLRAMELRSRIRSELGVRLDAVALLRGPSIRHISERILEILGHLATDGGDVPTNEAGLLQLLADLDRMSQGEVEHLLKRLGGEGS